MDAAQLPAFLTSGTVEDLLHDDVPAEQWSTRSYVEQVMGGPVSVHVRAADPDRGDVVAAVQEVWDLLHRIDDVFSLWREDSQLWRLRAEDLDPADADPMIGQVRALTDRAERATGGLFTTDLVGPDGARGWDPTGLVKGWAGDQAGRLLRRLPGIAYCVNAAGDVLCGRSLGGPRAVWEIGVEDPARRDRLAAVVPIVEGAVATSGTAARGEHIVDPRRGSSGEGAPRTTSAPRSVTVVGPELTWADAWATACFLNPGALVAAPPAWSGYRVAVQAG